MCSLGTDRQRLQSQLEFMADYVPQAASVLEIGCATGELAAHIQARLPIGRYEAIELSPAADVAEPRVTKLHRKPLVTVQGEGALPTGCFDLVIISHVLEHMRDIHREMKAMRLALKEDGILFVEVPNGAGNKGLPFDDNLAHLHFFSVNSLLHLLSIHGLSCLKATTGARLDARYSDSLRVLARPFRLPSLADKPLSRHPDLAGLAAIIVWGAGSLATEILANFLDTDRILFFVDRDPAKQGKTCLGRPIHGPEVLRDYAGYPILINSVDFGKSIRQDIEAICKDSKMRVIDIAELLDSISAGLGRVLN